MDQEDCIGRWFEFVGFDAERTWEDHVYDNYTWNELIRDRGKAFSGNLVYTNLGAETRWPFFVIERLP